MNDRKSSMYTQALKLERRTASLFVQSTGNQQCSANFGWGPGVRNHFLLHHVVRGRGVLICQDRRFELQAGDTFLVYPNTTVHYFADDQDPWEYVWVGFGGLDAADYVHRTDFTVEEPVFYGRDCETIASLMGQVYDHYGTEAWQEMEMTARLYGLLAFLVRSAQGREEGHEEPDCAQRAADYIITHYEEPITVEGLADYVSVSHSSLYRRFVKRFQISPKRFLLEYRIERACAMLATTGCSIQEVSNSVGFEDPFYFSRAFKEIKGVSPRQYANSVREK